MKNETRRAGSVNILQRSVCVTLSCHYLGNDRKGDLETVVEESGGALPADIDADQFGLTKKLIDRKELRPVMRVFGDAKALLRRLAFSSHRVFGERTYLIPDANLEAADEGLTECAARLFAEADAFSARYEDLVAAQKRRLGKQWRAADYLTPDAVRARFSLEWDYVSFEAPDRIEHVNRAVFRRATERFNSKVTAAAQDITLAAREAARAVVAGVAERLDPGTGPKRKALRDKALDDLLDYLALFRDKNIVDDRELESEVEALRRLVSGLDVETLREQPDARAAAQQAMQAAAARLDALVVPFRRGIVLPGRQVPAA